MRGAKSLIDRPMADKDDSLDVSRKYWTEELGDAAQFFASTATLRLARRSGDLIDGVLKTHGLSRNSYLALMALELSVSGSMILGRLAEELIVHPTTVTLTIDRLEAAECVTKTPHETDRRAVRAGITPKGRAIVAEATQALDVIGFGLVDLPLADVARLAEAVTEARRANGDLGSMESRVARWP
jgi:DNA-binding MarR family transcriptional regulator